MSAILANAVRARNERYINRLGEDVGKYLSFLSVMSRFHKYPADDLASFAMEAPATFSAVASAETWEKHFGRSIDTKAKGVTLVRNNDRTHYYDVSETVPITLGVPEVTLWHYDDTAHRPFLDAVVPGNADTEAKVAAIVAEEMKEVSARPSDRRLITLSTTAVVLERMGLPTADTTRQIARLSLDGRNMHNITEQTQKASQEILDAMQRSVMRGRADEADLSLPENNPLLSVFGVVTADLPEREEEAEEKASQGSLFDAFGEVPFDHGEQPLVGETPPPPTEAEEPDTLSTEWQSEDYATDEMMAEAEVLPEDTPSSEDEPSLEEADTRSASGDTEAAEDAVTAKETEVAAETEPADTNEAMVEAGLDDMPTEEEVLPEMEEDYQEEAVQSASTTTTAEPSTSAPAESSTEAPVVENPAASSATSATQTEQPIELTVEGGAKSFQEILDEDAVKIRGNSWGKNVFRANVLAIRTLQHIEAEHRTATEEERQILKQYAGFGGIPDAFDLKKTEWSSEVALLKEILSNKEYTAARGSVLNAHYTPNGIIQNMYHGLSAMGFSGGTVMEPSMGVGRFFAELPEGMRENSHLYGVELDSLTGRIAKALYPKAEVNVQGYNTRMTQSTTYCTISSYPPTIYSGVNNANLTVSTESVTSVLPLINAPFLCYAV